MKQEGKIWQKIYQRFYGLAAPVDEYKVQMINRIASRSLIIMFYYLLLANVIGFMIALHDPAVALWVLLGANSLVVVGVSGYIMFASRRLVTREVTSGQVVKTKRQVIKENIRGGLIFTILYYLLNSLIQSEFDIGSFWQAISAPNKLLGSLVLGVLFTVAMTGYACSKIHRGD